MTEEREQRDYLATLDRLIAKHPGGCGEGLRIAREAYEREHEAIDAGCMRFDGCRKFPLKYHDGHVNRCVVTGDGTGVPAPTSCPLRTKAVVVRWKGGDRG